MVATTTAFPIVVQVVQALYIRDGAVFADRIRDCMQSNPANGTEYDFIVVLLLEAGGHPPPFAALPRSYLATRGDSRWDWQFKTVPQKKTGFRYDDNMLGGSSSHNGMYFIRGNPHDFDRWAEMTGDHKWNYTNLLPYFKRTETVKGRLALDFLDRGHNGNIVVTEPNFSPLHEEWLAAGREFGLPAPTSDHNSNQTSSFFEAQFNIDEKGRRSGAYDGYILPAINRTNFHVLCFAHVLKVNLNIESMTAEGVTFNRQSQLITAKTRKEVVLSAGGYQTPKLLMLSGIGNSSHLLEHKIQPLLHVPAVGEWLVDHPAVYFGPFILNNSYIPLPVSGAQVEQDYALNGTGPLSGNGVSAGGLLSTTGDPSWPNIYVEFEPGLNINDLADVRDDTWSTHSASVYIGNGRPKSVGRVTLNSNNPFDSPLIDPNYFGNSDDLTSVVQGMKIIVRIIEGSSSLGGRYGAKLMDRKLASCEKFTARSDAYYTCYLEQNAGSGHHPTGTCRMGQSTDIQTSVADSRLHVNGVRSLRIADASVIPFITNANIHANCLMIGEKAADLLLEDWGHKLHIG